MTQDKAIQVRMIQNRATQVRATQGKPSKEIAMRKIKKAPLAGPRLEPAINPKVELVTIQDHNQLLVHMKELKLALTAEVNLMKQEIQEMRMAKVRMKTEMRAMRETIRR